MHRSTPSLGSPFTLRLTFWVPLRPQKSILRPTAWATHGNDSQTVKLQMVTLGVVRLKRIHRVKEARASTRTTNASLATTTSSPRAITATASKAYGHGNSSTCKWFMILSRGRPSHPLRHRDAYVRREERLNRLVNQRVYRRLTIIHPLPAVVPTSASSKSPRSLARHPYRTLRNNSGATATTTTSTSCKIGVLDFTSATKPGRGIQERCSSTRIIHRPCVQHLPPSVPAKLAIITTSIRPKADALTHAARSTPRISSPSFRMLHPNSSPSPHSIVPTVLVHPHLFFRRYHWPDSPQTTRIRNRRIPIIEISETGHDSALGSSPTSMTHNLSPASAHRSKCYVPRCLHLIPILPRTKRTAKRNNTGMTQNRNALGPRHRHSGRLSPWHHRGGWGESFFGKVSGDLVPFMSFLGGCLGGRRKRRTPCLPYVSMLEIRGFPQIEGCTRDMQEK
jgi:hypothetical protein